MAKRGRPKLQLDYELIERLAKIHCIQQEIADMLGVSTKTLQRNKEFCRIYNKGIQEGKMSLRRMQFETANKGNPTMQIWLGKQYLGQRDMQEANIGDSKEIIDKLNDISEALTEEEK